MLNHPIVRKDYVFAANFAREIRYNEQALVYSGLLAESAVLAARRYECLLHPHGDAAMIGRDFGNFSAAFRPKDRPQ